MRFVTDNPIPQNQDSELCNVWQLMGKTQKCIRGLGQPSLCSKSSQWELTDVTLHISKLRALVLSLEPRHEHRVCRTPRQPQSTTISQKPWHYVSLSNPQLSEALGGTGCFTDSGFPHLKLLLRGVTQNIYVLKMNEVIKLYFIYSAVL